MSFLSTAVQQVLEDARFCAVATSTPRGPLHAARLRLLGRACMAHDLAWLGEDARMEGRLRRRRPRASRRSRRHLHRHGQDLRRARPQLLGGGGHRRHLDRPRHRAVQQEERSILRRVRVRRPPGAARMDPAGPRLRGHRPRTNGPAGRGWRAGGPGSMGRRGDGARHVPQGEAGHRSARRAAARRGDDARSQRRGRADRLGHPRARRAPGAVARRAFCPLRGAPAQSLALAGAGPDAPVALTIDEASEWRARDMAGAMVQGTAALYVLDALGSGAKSARTIATALHPGAGALVRINPNRLVWWKGWSSGSAAAA